MRYILSTLLLAVLLFAACKKDKDEIAVPKKLQGTYLLVQAYYNDSIVNYTADNAITLQTSDERLSRYEHDTAAAYYYYIYDEGKKANFLIYYGPTDENIYYSYATNGDTLNMYKAQAFYSIPVKEGFKYVKKK